MTSESVRLYGATVGCVLGGLLVAVSVQACMWKRRLRLEVACASAGLQDSVHRLEEKNALLSRLNRDLEHGLTERNHRLNEVFESLPGEVSWVSRDLRYVRVNTSLSQSEGLYPRDFEGRPVGFTGREPYKMLRTLLQDFFASDKPQTQAVVEVRYERESETRILFLRKFRASGDDALVVCLGLPAGVAGAASDAAGERLVAEKNRALGSARLASLGEMVAGIAHEINNPLAIINGRVQMLRTKAVSGQLANEELLLSLGRLSQTVFRTSKIITGLRSFVRPGTGEQPEDLVPVRAIEDALDFCKGRFHKHNIRIVLEVSSGRLVRCVPVQLSQILLNLLNNSLHALDGGPGEKWVRIEAADAGTNIEFRVVDSGPGVAPDTADRIFEPFFTTKDFSKGTGLGLSISRGLAEGNGGSLRLDDGAAHTTFVLTLPSVADSTGAAVAPVKSEVVPEELPG